MKKYKINNEFHTIPKKHVLKQGVNQFPGLKKSKQTVKIINNDKLYVTWRKKKSLKARKKGDKKLIRVRLSGTPQAATLDPLLKEWS